MYQGSIILLVFATEIALKGMLRLKVGNFTKTHNLKKLYEFIPPDSRDRISEIYKSKFEQIDSTLESLFEEHKNLFTDFRYLDGSMHIAPNPQLLCEAVNSIVDYYNEIKDR